MGHPGEGDLRAGEQRAEERTREDRRRRVAITAVGRNQARRLGLVSLSLSVSWLGLKFRAEGKRNGIEADLNGRRKRNYGTRTR